MTNSEVLEALKYARHRAYVTDEEMTITVKIKAYEEGIRLIEEFIKGEVDKAL